MTHILYYQRMTLHLHDPLGHNQFFVHQIVPSLQLEASQSFYPAGPAC